MHTAASLARTVVRGNPDVIGLLVVDSTGNVDASESTSAEILSAAVAVTVPLRELLDRAAGELGCGEMRATLVEGSEASLAIADVDGLRCVVVIGATGAAPGALRADSLWVAECLRREGLAS